MAASRKPDPSDVLDEEWTLVAPYLMLLPEAAGQREQGLRDVFNGLGHGVTTGAPWRWKPHDLPPSAVHQKAQPWPPAASKRWPRISGRLCG